MFSKIKETVKFAVKLSKMSTNEFLFRLETGTLDD